MLLPEFDQVYVISDLHLGGEPGFRIFNAFGELEWFIQHLTNHEPTQKIGLILNGDIVDFLAMEPATYFDAQDALKKLCRTFGLDQNGQALGESDFHPIWLALKQFVATKKRHLVLVLGNHDVELALPEIQEFLRRTLCAEDDAAIGRLTFAMDGTGYACSVGERKVLCLHGNEVDSWNVVDYHALDKQVRHLNRIQKPPTWKPNAGTQMVIDIMNDMKKKYRWIDLLKPETELAVPVLAAIRPKRLQDLRQLLKLTNVKKTEIYDSLRLKGGLLGAESESEADVFEQELLSSHNDLKYPHIGDEAKDALDAVEKLFEKGVSPLDLVDDVGTLGLASRSIELTWKRSSPEQLRKTLLGWIQSDQTFDESFEDECFSALDELVGRSVDFIIAGHTHLRRALHRKKGNGYYFNSGSWIRLMQITEDMLANDTKFQFLWDLLGDGSIEKLDQAGEKPNGFDVVCKKATVICITKSGQDQVRGEMLEVLPNQNNSDASSFTLERVTNVEPFLLKAR